MSDTPDTTAEDFAKQEEERRQQLIEEDVALHAETDEPSPFPGDSADRDGDEAPKPKKVKAAKKAKPDSVKWA